MCSRNRSLRHMLAKSVCTLGDIKTATVICTVDCPSLTNAMSACHHVLGHYEGCWHCMIFSRTPQFSACFGLTLSDTVYTQQLSGRDCMIVPCAAQDENTRYVCIGPVNKAINMLCCWLEDPQSAAFKRSAATLLRQHHVSPSHLQPA